MYSSTEKKDQVRILKYPLIETISLFSTILSLTSMSNLP